MYVSRKEDESIPVQKWNSLQGGQVYHTDAATGESDDGGYVVFSSSSNEFQ